MAIVKDLVEIGKQLATTSNALERLEKLHKELVERYYYDKERFQAVNGNLRERIEILEDALHKAGTLPKALWWLK